jgi:hypothetical protein
VAASISTREVYAMPGKRIYYYLAVLAIAGAVILYNALRG